MAATLAPGNDPDDNRVGCALAAAIDEIALRLAIPREEAREIAKRAIAALREDIARRGLPADDLPQRWVER
jgi:hypothetical protein